jgi:DNA-binding NarL/FixJ family response regulator
LTRLISHAIFAAMNNIHVAIVEDIKDIREAMRVLIDGSSGFDCNHVFENAEAAIEALPNINPDVVLMDINLPGMSGIECISKLKQQLPHTQFMMCTVYDDDDNIFDALQAGATGYILKRTSPAQILEAIRDLHHGGSPMSSEIARRVVASLQKKNKNEHTEILSSREKEILKLLAEGYIYKEIAGKLFVGLETVKTHIHNIYEKLQVQNRAEALKKVYSR